MSRRDQIRMTDEAMRDFLAQRRTVIFNTIARDGVPHPAPMWYAIDEDGALVMTTFTKSQKIKNLRRDPRVSLLVEDGTDYTELRGVVIYGTAELIQDAEDVTGILVAVSVRQGTAVTDALRDQMRRTAAKRTGIRVKPVRLVSWDHRRLGGAY